MEIAAPERPFHAVIVTIFPELIEAVASVGIFGRAVERGLIRLETINPRSYTEDRHQTVDSKAYGGGPGMVMKVGPLRAALQEARRRCPEAKVIYLSPQGAPFVQRKAALCAAQGQVILLAGRYEGIDQRLIDRDVDEQWSLGDYVLSGGELPALVVLDAVARLRPGSSEMRAPPRRNLSVRACLISRIIRALRKSTGSECRRCCSAATTAPSPPGDRSRRRR